MTTQQLTFWLMDDPPGQLPLFNRRPQPPQDTQRLCQPNAPLTSYSRKPPHNLSLNSSPTTSTSPNQNEPANPNANRQKKAEPANADSA